MNETNYPMSSLSSTSPSTTTLSSPLDLTPRAESVAAVAEEEGEKQGIRFKSRAESGTGCWQVQGMGAGTGGSAQASIGGGSTLLAEALQQNLIWDQHDRAIMEQDRALQSRVDRAKAKVEEERKQKTKTE